jgi:OFA family oxalate/formate antiporter-like MFS transporter
MGNVEVLGGWFGVGAMAALGVTAVAVGNTAGRLFWGRVLDRLGQRRAMLASQTMMLAAVVTMLVFGGNGAVFLAAAAAIGFCYGSNFAIFPATVAALYGAERMGSIYSWVMAAQGISSLGSIAGGHLFTATGSYYPGLGIGAVAITCGLVLTLVLSKRLGLR